MREFLKGMGIDDDSIDAIMVEHGKLISKQINRYDMLQEQLAQAKDDAKAAAEAAEKKIAEAVADKDKAAAEHKAEMAAVKIDMAVEAALTAAGARNKTAARALLDLSKAELADDGTVKGLSEQLEALAKGDDTSFLFATEAAGAAGTQPIKGAKPGESGVEKPDNKVDFARMGIDELAAYMAANPGVQIPQNIM
jgi:hypothetical protein